MKKFIILFSFLLGIVVTAYGQKVSYDGSDGMEWQFKRCYMKGETCIVDLVVTNMGRKDMSYTLYWFPDAGTTGIVAYDDEGNTYNYQNIRGTFGKAEFGTYNVYDLVVPREVSLKLHCEIRDFDEFAAMVKVLKFPLVLVDNTTYNRTRCSLQIKDIPVPRE
jgi:hypothetical protein